MPIPLHFELSLNFYFPCLMVVYLSECFKQDQLALGLN